MVGNGVTNWVYDCTPALLEMGFWHSLYDYKTYKKIKELKCDFSLVDFDIEPSSECMDLFNKVNDGIDKVNIYNIFGYCYGLPIKDGSHENLASPNELGFTTVGGQIKTYKKSFTAADYTPWAHHTKYKKKNGLKETPPCVNGQYIIEYLNRADVRAALHVPDSYPGWDMCNSHDWF
jgi:hypothetical protein